MLEGREVFLEARHARYLKGQDHSTGVIQGGTGGDDPPQNFGWGDDIAHIPPNKLSAQLRKITICLDNTLIIICLLVCRLIYIVFSVF